MDVLAVNNIDSLAANLSTYLGPEQVNNVRVPSAMASTRRVRQTGDNVMPKASFRRRL